GSTLELRAVVELVLHFALTLVGYDAAAVHVFNAGQLDLALTMFADGSVAEGALYDYHVLNDPLYGGMGGDLPLGHPRGAGGPVVGALVVSDTSREPLWRGGGGPLAAAVSWIGAPLLVDGEYVAILDLCSGQAGRYEQEDADAVAQFAQQVGFAVRNAR